MWGFWVSRVKGFRVFRDSGFWGSGFRVKIRCCRASWCVIGIHGVWHSGFMLLPAFATFYHGFMVSSSGCQGVGPRS